VSRHVSLIDVYVFFLFVNNLKSVISLLKIEIGIVGGGVQLGPLGTAATNGLSCQPRVMMMMMQKLVE
jgi:hypothetical protein